VLQQRELRGVSVRVRAVAALLRVFLSACFGARQSFVSIESLGVRSGYPARFDSSQVKNYFPNTQNRNAS